ncbi:hypothetical protein [Niveispirillum sp. BGYR6]|uniref:hypothetical protein n=1 Tax=Niveispirillum sp. BGYR6 TaxID=2971249 RepID=UPI0022B94F8E|nr:hypothetical protein [Niveispirillum sp. BGYR6]MDG5497956.1 hypothetical protein [Niveispirillum sp. BGYR6]
MMIAVMGAPPAKNATPSASASPLTTLSPHMLVQVDTGSQGCVINVGNLYTDGKYTVEYETIDVPNLVNLNGSTESKNTTYMKPTSISQTNMLDGVQYIGPGSIEYTSDANSEYGFYYRVKHLGIGVNKDGTAAAIVENAVVLGIVPKDVMKSSPSPVTVTGPTKGGPLMMGVGFGRPNMGTNTLVNACTQDGTSLYPSYLINKDGITLGITPEKLPSAFAFQKLGANPDPKGAAAAQNDGVNPGVFATPVGTITIVPTNPPKNPPVTLQNSTPPMVNIIIDTGITFMMMGGGEGVTEGAYTITISTTVDGQPDPNRPALSYNFNATGPTSAGRAADYPGALATNYGSGKGETLLAPAFVAPRGDKDWTNTGIHVLRGFQLYADAQVGQMGFAPISG